MLSMGRTAQPILVRLKSVSKLKRLELRERAEGPNDKERKDFPAARELIPKLFVLTPKPGTQQDGLLQDSFCIFTVLEGLQESLSSHVKILPRLTGLP